jgi:peptidyl-prolyl cis-trans isomerase C
MLADYVKKNPVKDAEIQAEYDKYKAAVGPTEYHSRHILVATEQEAKDIIAKLKGGANSKNWPKHRKIQVRAPMAAIWAG